VAIGSLAAEISGLMGVTADITEDKQRLRPKDSEVLRLVCDASKLRDHTGWRPRRTREEGLRATIDWLRQPGNLAQYNPSDYSK
jgi:NDP-hexose 4,6-dehydratase